MNESLILDSIRYSVKKKEILKGCYLEVLKGKITSLTGLNGSGKSTLLKVAAGQITPANGITILQGERLFKKEKTKRFKHICYLPQESFLNPYLKLNTYLKFLDYEITETKFDKYKNERVKNLSGGLKRYFEACIVLSLNRDFYVLDEPFSGIEPYLIESLIKIIQDHKNNNKGILLTDHYQKYVSPISDRSYLMNDGNCRLIDLNN